MQNYPYSESLHRLDKAVKACQEAVVKGVDAGHGYSINPTLEVLQFEWQGLVHAMDCNTEPEVGEETILVWKHAQSETVHYRSALPNDLLALKLIHESIDIATAATEGGVTIGALEQVL